MTFRWKTWSVMSRVVSRTKCSLGRAMKLAALKKWSTIIRIVLPAKGASPVMKSKAMWDQGHPGIGKGWKSTNGEELVTVF